MTNTEILCFILGWQGGSVHQVARALSVDASTIINATPDEMRQLCRRAQIARD